MIPWFVVVLTEGSPSECLLTRLKSVHSLIPYLFKSHFNITSKFCFYSNFLEKQWIIKPRCRNHKYKSQFSLFSAWSCSLYVLKERSGDIYILEEPTRSNLLRAALLFWEAADMPCTFCKSIIKYCELASAVGVPEGLDRKHWLHGNKQSPLFICRVAMTSVWDTFMHVFSNMFIFFCYETFLKNSFINL
jgi:hypothetical protein